LKLQYDSRLSNFAFNFNLRRFTLVFEMGSTTPWLTAEFQGGTTLLDTG
jgi:hypothetical protein